MCSTDLVKDAIYPHILTVQFPQIFRNFYLNVSLENQSQQFPQMLQEFLHKCIFRKSAECIVYQKYHTEKILEESILALTCSNFVGC